MKHVALLGDSVFDNGDYIDGAPDVAAQLKAELADNGTSTLVAVDGDCIRDVESRLSKLPSDATHLVLSIGGNDALDNLKLISADFTGDLLTGLIEAQARFRSAYEELMGVLLSHDLPLTVCTVYNGCFPDPDFQQRAKTALSIFNDCIVSGASQHGIPIIDLRSVCSSAEDFANPIEPSAIGGEKIAKTIVRVLSEHDFSITHTKIYR